MRQRVVTILSAVLLATGLLVGAGLATAPPASARVKVIEVPHRPAGLGRIVGSPDGALWFLEEVGQKVARLAPDGSIAEFPLPTLPFPSGRDLDLDVAPDGSAWVLYGSGVQVLHLDAAGATLADVAVGGRPLESAFYGERLRVGPDGAAWVTRSSLSGSHDVVRVVGDQLVAPEDPYEVGPACDGAIGRGGDGSMWCHTAGGLTQLGPDAGAVSSYPADQGAAYPRTITAGPVGSVWFGSHSDINRADRSGDGAVGYVDATSGAVVAFGTGSRTAPGSWTTAAASSAS